MKYLILASCIMIVLGLVTGLYGAALLSMICVIFYYWAFRKVDDYPYEEQGSKGKAGANHSTES